MRNSFYIGLLFILLGLMALMIKFNLDVESVRHELACEAVIKDKKIEELEKEIRILKTDVHVLQYGFSEDQNAEQN